MYALCMHKSRIMLYVCTGVHNHCMCCIVMYIRIYKDTDAGKTTVDCRVLAHVTGAYGRGRVEQMTTRKWHKFPFQPLPQDVDGAGEGDTRSLTAANHGR